MRFDRRLKPELIACQDVTRENLSHVELDTTSKRLVATNGHSMIVVPVEVDEEDTSGAVTERALDAARRVAKERKLDEAEIKVNGSLGVEGATYDRPRRKYTNYQHVIPTLRGPITIGLNARAFASSRRPSPLRGIWSRSRSAGSSTRFRWSRIATKGRRRAPTTSQRMGMTIRSGSSCRADDDRPIPGNRPLR
jgi:hypothetical protein